MEKTNQISVKENVTLSTFLSLFHMSFPTTDGRKIQVCLLVVFHVSVSLATNKFETVTHRGIHIRVFSSFTLS